MSKSSLCKYGKKVVVGGRVRSAEAAAAAVNTVEDHVPKLEWKPTLQKSFNRTLFSLRNDRKKNNLYIYDVEKKNTSGKRKNIFLKGTIFNCKDAC